MGWKRSDELDAVASLASNSDRAAATSGSAENSVVGSDLMELMTTDGSDQTPKIAEEESEVFGVESIGGKEGGGGDDARAESVSMKGETTKLESDGGAHLRRAWEFHLEGGGVAESAAPFFGKGEASEDGHSKMRKGEESKMRTGEEGGFADLEVSSRLPGTGGKPSGEAEEGCGPEPEASGPPRGTGSEGAARSNFHAPKIENVPSGGAEEESGLEPEVFEGAAGSTIARSSIPIVATAPLLGRKSALKHRDAFDNKKLPGEIESGSISGAKDLSPTYGIGDNGAARSTVAAAPSFGRRGTLEHLDTFDDRLRRKLSGEAETRSIARPKYSSQAGGMGSRGATRWTVAVGNRGSFARKAFEDRLQKKLSGEVERRGNDESLTQSMGPGGAVRSTVAVGNRGAFAHRDTFDDRLQKKISAEMERSSIAGAKDSGLTQSMGSYGTARLNAPSDGGAVDEDAGNRARALPASIPNESPASLSYGWSARSRRLGVGADNASTAASTPYRFQSKGRLLNDGAVINQIGAIQVEEQAPQLNRLFFRNRGSVFARSMSRRAARRGARRNGDDGVVANNAMRITEGTVSTSIGGRTAHNSGEGEGGAHRVTLEGNHHEDEEVLSATVAHRAETGSSIFERLSTLHDSDEGEGAPSAVLPRGAGGTADEWTQTATDNGGSSSVVINGDAEVNESYPHSSVSWNIQPSSTAQYQGTIGSTMEERKEPGASATQTATDDFLKNEEVLRAAAARRGERNTSGEGRASNPFCSVTIEDNRHEDEGMQSATVTHRTEMRRTMRLPSFISGAISIGGSSGGLIEATLVEDVEVVAVAARRVTLAEKYWKAFACAAGIFVSVLLAISLSVFSASKSKSDEVVEKLATATPTLSPTFDPRPTLEIVQERGYVLCGLNDEIIKSGEGLYLSLCRAVASVVVGNPDSFVGVPTTYANRWQQLLDRTVDLVILGDTYTLEREIREPSTASGFTFSSPYAYVGMVYIGNETLVHCAEKHKRYDECSSLNICVEPGTTYHSYLKGAFPPDSLTVNSSLDGLAEMLSKGTCNVIASDQTITRSILLHNVIHGGNFFWGEKLVTKEPVAIISRNTDREFSDILNWVIQALFSGEEQGLTKDVSRCQNQTSLTLHNASKLDFMNAVFCVGNYAEIIVDDPNNRRMNQINHHTGMLDAIPFGNLESDFEGVAEGVLAKIVKKRMLICGVIVPDIFEGDIGSSGQVVGMSVDYCRTLSAAIFIGDPKKVKILTFAESDDSSFISLANGTLDVLVGGRDRREFDFNTPQSLGGLHFSTPFYYGNESAGDDVSFYSMTTRDADLLFSSFVNCVVLGTIQAQANDIQKSKNREMPLVSVFGSKLSWALRDAIGYSGSYDEIYAKHFSSEIVRASKGRNQLNDGGPQMLSFLHRSSLTNNVPSLFESHE